MIINLYHPSDPECKGELWHFVYLDGLAESHNEDQGFAHPDWEWAAPDLVAVNLTHEEQNRLNAGEYECLLYGKPAIAILSKRGWDNSPMQGRVVLKEETPERIAHNRDPKKWM
jgi:hypothetical protein